MFCFFLFSKPSVVQQQIATENSWSAESEVKLSFSYQDAKQKLHEIAFLHLCFFQKRGNCEHGRKKTA